MILVREMMNNKVISVKPEEVMKTLCRILTTNKITGVPVVNNKKEIIGFVSERDIVAAATRTRFFEKKAKDIMVKEVQTVDVTTTLNEVSQIFSREPFRHLPVVHDGKLVGIITRNDIVNQMLGNYY